MTIHRFGPVLLDHFDVAVTGVVPTNTIEPGDAVAFVADKVVPAGVFTWTTDLATTQTNFATAFLGISEGRSRAATDDIRDLRLPVNMDGVYEFDVAVAAAFNVGDYIGVAQVGATNFVQSKVVEVATSARAIARVIRAAPAGSTKVVAALINTIAKR
jgi:hypothetical protein